MSTDIKLLKLFRGLNLTEEELEHLYKEFSSKINDIPFNIENTTSDYYFSNSNDGYYHYLMLNILHRLKAPLKSFQKHFRFLNLSNPVNYHYNVWASLCLAEYDSSDFNIDYSLTLKGMFNVAIQSHMHQVEENQRLSVIEMSDHSLELEGLEWGNPSYGEWGNIESITDAEESTWSPGYISFSLGDHCRRIFEVENLPEEIHFALIGNWKKDNSIIKHLEDVCLSYGNKIYFRLNSEKKLIIEDEFTQSNYYDLQSLMTLFLLMLGDSDILNLKKVVMALLNNELFSHKFQNLNNVINNLDLFQEKKLHFDYLEIFKLIFYNTNNFKQLIRQFKVEELGSLLLNGIQSYDSKSKTSVFNLINGKSFSYTWVLYDYNDIKSDNYESDNYDLPF